MAAATVLTAGGGAAGAVLLWPGSAAANQAGPGTTAAHGASLNQAMSIQYRQPVTETADAQQLRLSMLDAQRTIAARAARKAAREAAARAAAARAARLAAQQRAAQQAQQQAQQQAAQQQAPQQASAPSSAPAGSAQQIAMGMLGSFGWSSSQFSCLDQLWGHESGWNVSAENPSSGAYGIPQALPGSKMASAGPDWQSNAATQIRWGLGYIKGLYGSPCGAWSHEESTGWY
jgi:hypothetical protein